jgi:hypothetical protein
VSASVVTVSDVIAFVVAYSFEGVSVVTGSTCRDAGAVVTVKRSNHRQSIKIDVVYVK